MLLTFLRTQIVYFVKKVKEIYWCSLSIEYKEKGTYWILRIFTFNNKNPLILPLQIFDGQSHQGVT